MTEEQKLLISFISIALGRDEISLPIRGIDWERVIGLSYQQEVAALLFDGYQQVQDKIGNQSIDKKSLLNWVGSILYQEAQYDRQFQLARELSTLFHEQGICTYILKGFSIAKCYPNPNHRFFCDFDCFLIGKQADGSLVSMYDVGNRLIEAKGIDVDKRYYKNSSFHYLTLHVENHRFCCSIKRGKRTKRLERYLEQLLYEAEPVYLDDTRIALPPLLFQALFLIEHACGHFLYDKMRLKNICDWSQFRKCYNDKLDWEKFYEICNQNGLNRFVETMDHLSDYILGICDFSILTNLEKKVLYDTLRPCTLPQNAIIQRIRKTLNMFCSGWKFKNFSIDSMLGELSNSAYAYLFDKNPRIDV